MYFLAEFAVDKLDLNLLRTLTVLLEEKNTHRAAERLGVSQPTVSRALGKLREQLKDPLFFREKKGLRLSARGESLAQTLPLAFEGLMQTLEPEHFDPKKWQGCLRIVLNTFLAKTHGRSLYRTLKQEMPGVELEFFSWGDDTCDQIESGHLHLALSHSSLNLPQTFVQHRVGCEEFGLMGRKGLDVLERDVEIEDLGRYPVGALISPPVNSRSMPLRKNMAKRGIDLNVALRSQHLQPLLDIMEEEDVVMLVPQALAAKLGEGFGFARFRDESETTVSDINLIYSSRNRHSHMYDWLEQWMLDLFAKK